MLVSCYCCRADTYEHADGKASSDVAMTSNEDDEAASPSGSGQEYPCIIKATNGKSAKRKGGSAPSTSAPSQKIKISTLVQPADYPSFSLAYGQLLKSTFAQTMRVKRKGPKARAPGKAKGGASAEASKSAKKKAKTISGPMDERVLPKITGPRRGAGHAGRQARFRARVKAANKILASRRRKEEHAKPMFPDLLAKATAS